MSFIGKFLAEALYYTKTQVDNLLTAYEPVFSKNTAFNKNFGSGATDVPTGNHTHSIYATLTGAIFTGAISFNNVLQANQETNEFGNEQAIILDASAYSIEVDISGGGSDGQPLFVIAMNIDNGATLSGVALGNYEFTSAGESLTLLYFSNADPAGWYIVGKYSP